MLQSRPAIGPDKAFQIKEFAIRRNSMESNPTDAFKCHRQFQTANRNANSAGET